MTKLAATERRLRKNADHAKVYDEQIKDMVARNVARKLSIMADGRVLRAL